MESNQNTTGWDIKNAFSQIAATEIVLQCIHYVYIPSTIANENTIHFTFTAPKQ